jgi:hypothetical protein
MRSRDFGPLETTVNDQDFLVERRGFEPLTSAVQAPARLTGSSLPFVGDVGVVRDNATQLKFTPGSMGSRIDERGTAVCLSQLNPRPVTAQSCTRVDDRDGCRTGD